MPLGQLNVRVGWRAGVVVAFGLALTGCSIDAKCTPFFGPHSSKAEDVEVEARRTAEHIAALLYKKCSEGYFWGQDGKSIGPYEKINISAKRDRMVDKDRFVGYEWKGTALFFAQGSHAGSGFRIYKRLGKWFIRLKDDEKGVDDVEVAALQSVQPSACASN
jgi:hypothetical protein